MGLIKQLKCIETPAGYLLSWDIAEGASVARTTVYGINDAREFVLESPLVSTGRLLLSPDNYNLLTAFKVSVACSDGTVETTLPIVPQKLVKAERLLYKDMISRYDKYVKCTPIGSYKCTVLLRRIDGEKCPRCGSEVCSGRGGRAVSDYCPLCLGVGIADPYYVYPVDQLIHAVSPRDDNDKVENPAVARNLIIRTFLSTFPLGYRVNDVLVSGTEVYRIIQQDVKSSVGNLPVTYVLTVQKYQPEDPRYDTFVQLAGGKGGHDL